MSANYDIVEVEIGNPYEQESFLVEEMNIASESAKRIHAGFPTFSETAKDSSVAFSDHLPVLAQVPLSSEAEGPTLNILSLNTLGRNLGASGIHKNGTYEAEEEIGSRYARIVDFLARSANHHSLSSIVLQETEVEIMLPILKEGLPSAIWGFEASDHGLITCYNKRYLTLIGDGALLNKKTRVLSASFRDLKNNIIHLHNSWGMFSPFSRDRENEYKALLTPETNDKANVLRIVMGDTNSRIAPLDDRARNIVTGAIPMVFQREKGYPPEMQLGDYPDGGFYTDPQGRIRQMETVTLDFETGGILPEEDDRENISWVNEYRMLMCLDYSYATKEIIEGKTLSEYEKALRERTEDAGIQICMTANSMNDKGIAIRFSDRSVYNALKTLDGIQCVIIESDQPVPVVFVPVERIPALVVAINEHLGSEIYDLADLLDRMDTAINRLLNGPGFSLFNRAPHDKIESLGSLRQSLQDLNITKHDVLSIIRRWENEERIVVQAGKEVSKTNAEILGEHRNKLRGIFLDENDPTVTSEFLDTLKAGVN